MADVFISYAREDRQVARTVAELVASAGATVWWDPELLSGDDFRETIEAELRDAKSVIVIWTAASITSHFVRDEAGRALAANKLCPITVGGVEPPLGFGSMHALAFDEDGVDDDIRSHRLLRSLERMVKRPLKLVAAEPTAAAGVIEQSASTNTRIFDIDSEALMCAVCEPLGLVWVTARTSIRAIDIAEGAVLTDHKTGIHGSVPAQGNSAVFTYRSGGGYQAPDTYHFEEWKASRADSSVSSPVSVQRIDEFFAWSWVDGAVAASLAGDFAMVFNEDGKFVRVWSEPPGGREPRGGIALPLEESETVGAICFSDRADMLISIDWISADPDAKRISAWSLPEGELRHRHQIRERSGPSFIVPGPTPDTVVLGFDNYIAVYLLSEGVLENTMETPYRIRAMSASSNRQRVAIVTDAELAVVDLVSSTEGPWTLGHDGGKGIDCSLGSEYLAGVIDRDSRHGLLLWKYVADT